MQPPLPFVPTAEDYADFFGDNEPELWEPRTIDHDTGEIINEQQALAQLDQSWSELAKVRTIREALDLGNKAAAVAYYLKLSGAELEVQNRAAAVRLLSEYKAGQMLREIPKNTGTRTVGGNPSGGNTMLPPDETPTLTDLGITKMQSSRLQTLAELDEDEVAEYIEETAEKGKEVTTAGAVKKGKSKKLARKRGEHDAQAQAAPVKPLVTRASWSEWLPAQPACDLLFTDPPYSTDVDDIEAFAAAWLPLALSKVKTTGRAYVCIGAYPDELRAYLNADRANMILAQVLVWTYRNTLGPTPKNDYKLNWQAVLYFRGADAPPLDSPTLNELWSVQDVNAPDGRLGNRYHAWQKPDELAERLIRHSTKPGDLVLDPFNGTGTFVLAATHLGRVARGCDTDDAMLGIAKQRGCDIAE